MRTFDFDTAVHGSAAFRVIPPRFTPNRLPDHDQIERLVAASRAARNAHIAALAGKAARAVMSGASALAAVVRRWQAAHETRDSLMRLSDHQLRDIGLTRDDVEVLAGDILSGRTRLIAAEVIRDAKPVLLPRAVNANAGNRELRRAA